MKFIICILIALTIGGAVRAQDIDGTTGTHLAHDAMIKDLPVLWDQLAKCVADRFPVQSQAWLVTLPGSQDEDAAMKRIDFDRCFDSTRTIVINNGVGMKMPRYNTRMYVAEALLNKWRRDIPAALPMGVSASSKPWFASLIEKNQGKNVYASGLGSEEFGHCVVSTNWEAALAFSTGEDAGNSQRGALKALAPALGQCLPDKQTFNLNAKLLRAIVANAIYHIAFPSDASSPHAGH